MENKITVYDVQKVMLTAFQDPNIVASFMEMLYDYFNSTAGIAKTSLQDQAITTKYIDIVTKKKVDSLKTISNIKDLYASFVINVINTKSLEFYLGRNNPEYTKIKCSREPDIHYCAAGAVSVLDLSNETDSIFRIYLIN